MFEVHTKSQHLPKFNVDSGGSAGQLVGKGRRRRWHSECLLISLRSFVSKMPTVLSIIYLFPGILFGSCWKNCAPAVQNINLWPLRAVPGRSLVASQGSTLQVTQVQVLWTFPHLFDPEYSLSLVHIPKTEQSKW